ncbi:ras guanine nucleotide exchange factor domain-containing protein [Powellomyces hirtus]|nr:ras guanine nucleotide exchange factor domain-containing protein [Powellomyces hirtus]
MSGESLVWHFPSVPKRGAGAAPKAPPSTSQTPSPLQTISSTSSFENSPSHQPPPYRMLSSQPQPVVAPPRSETPPTRSLQRPAAYLPLIPTSPLVHQHRFISEQYNAAGAQLQALEKAQHTGRPSAATAGVLSQVRRLVETTGLAKRKLAQLSGSISEWDRKPLVEVSPAELAQAILCYDVDMFRGIKPTEIVSHAISNSTAVPDSVKRALDFSFFLHRIVQSTILDHDQPIDRASSIVRWILVAQALCIQRDFHATNAICCALSSPAVADLKKTWKLVSKKYRGIYADIPKALVLSTNGWKGYRHELNHVEKPCVPVVDALIHAEAGDATRMLEMCKEDEENWDRDVGPVGNPVNGIGPMHWLVTRRWMPAEQVERMSRAWEPRPEKPGSPAGSISSASSAGNENTDDALLRRFNRLGFSKK